MSVTQIGLLTQGVTCWSLLTPLGQRMSLLGDIPPEFMGAMVEVKGEWAELSFCMAGRTIAVTSIERLPRWWLDRTVQAVARVDSVSVIVQRTNPASYVITVKGGCRTTGWTGHRLRKLAVDEQSGHAIFVACAAAPHGEQAQTETAFELVHEELMPSPRIGSFTILALDGSYEWPEPASDSAGVLGTAVAGIAAAGDGGVFPHRVWSSGGGTPWPWRCKSPKDPFGEELLGKSVRVYKTGDGLTTDYVPDRCNLELHPETLRVVRVWLG